MAFRDDPDRTTRGTADNLLDGLKMPHLGGGFLSFLFDDRLLYEGLLTRRVFGNLADLAILGLLTLAAYVFVFLFGILSFGLLLPVGFLTVALLPLAYYSLFLAYWGATPGMAMFDIEGRALDGSRPTLFQAALRTALFLVSVPPTAGLVLLVALLNDKARTMHDYFSGVIVVRSAHFASKTRR